MNPDLIEREEDIAYLKNFAEVNGFRVESLPRGIIRVPLRVPGTSVRVNLSGVPQKEYLQAVLDDCYLAGLEDAFVRREVQGLGGRS